MNINEFCEKHGSRKTARAIISKRISQLCGLSLSDLPDSSELCDLTDSMEEIIGMNIGNLQHPDVLKELKGLMDDVINKDNIESLIVG